MHILDNPKSREYKSFTCQSCGYKADVFGEIQKDYNGTFETHVCLNCKTLMDCCTEDVKFIDKDGIDIEIEFIPVEPRCLSCDKNDLILWDSDMCKCPKCEEKMKLTRLDLNLDDIGTIRIFDSENSNDI